MSVRRIDRDPSDDRGDRGDGDGGQGGEGAGDDGDRTVRADRAHEEYCARRHFGSLDGLRFLCIAAVVWHHAPIRTNVDLPLLLERGFLGVDFFFVLSGYLITTLLLREEGRTGRFSLSAFYWRRLLRIVPVYVALVVAVSVYWVVLKGDTELAPLIPFYLLFLANFLTEHIPLLAPMWSLSVEEQYYLVWPPLLLVVPRRWMPSVLVALVALNVWLAAIGFVAGGDLAVDAGRLELALPTPTYAPILLGSALAMLLHERRTYRVLHRVLAGPRTPVVAFAIVLALSAFVPDDLVGLPYLAIHLAMTACLATLVLDERHVLAPVLRWPPIVRIGVVSYGLYLYHLVGLDLATRALEAVGIDSRWAVAAVYPVISYVIAEVSFRTLEAYFRGVRDRRSGGVPAPAAPS